MSKLFQSILKPSKMIPYFWSMKTSPSSHEDVTITTMITTERLGIFVNLVKNYKGRDFISIPLEYYYGLSNLA